MQISRPLACSLLLNGVLGGILTYRCLLAPPAPEHPSPPLPLAVSQPPRAVPEAQPSPAPTPAPFQWSSLESPDYPTYIANLRKISCPERTIRDIISADITALYAQKRAALAEQKLEPTALYRATVALQEEEVHLLNRLLGTSLPSSVAAAASQAGTASAQRQAPSGISASTSSSATVSHSPQATVRASSGFGGQMTPGTAASANPATALSQPQTGVQMPLAFQPVDAGSLKLNNQQGTALERIQKNFVQEIGGANQNPNDPGYLTRWQGAQASADEQLKGILGWQLYFQYQRDALQQARQKTP